MTTLHSHDVHEVGSIEPSPAATEVNVKNDTPAEPPTVSFSFKVKRQTMVTIVLAILLVISALETVELQRIHKALAAWKSLPNITSVSTPSANTGSSSNSLPAQVGGC